MGATSKPQPPRACIPLPLFPLSYPPQRGAGVTVTRKFATFYFMTLGLLIIVHIKHRERGRKLRFPCFKVTTWQRKLILSLLKIPSLILHSRSRFQTDGRGVVGLVGDGPTGAAGSHRLLRFRKGRKISKY